MLIPGWKSCLACSSTQQDDMWPHEPDVSYLLIDGNVLLVDGDVWIHLFRSSSRLGSADLVAAGWQLIRWSAAAAESGQETTLS